MKKASVLALLLSSLVITILGGQGAQGWRGIVPLHSSRADVERLLGSGTGSCKCEYRMDDVNAFFYYSSGNCKSGWNIPPDTVVRIVIYPKRKSFLTDLNMDQSQFQKKRDGDVASIVSYWNKDEGLLIEMHEYTGVVTGFFYGATARDENLRCP